MTERENLQAKLPALIALLNNPNYQDTLDDRQIDFELKHITRRIDRLVKRVPHVKQKRQNEAFNTR